MSSENRSITPNTLDSAVPPLNTGTSANSEPNRTPRSQHTQKSFSRITADAFRRAGVTDFIFAGCDALAVLSVALGDG